MPRLVVIKGPMLGRSFELKGETAFVGRSLKNDIQIKDGAISRKHLKVFRIGKKYFVEDLRSTNGTMVNGEIITPGEGYEIEERDPVSIGHTVIRLDGISTGKGLGTDEFESRPARVYSNEEGQVPRERRSGSGKGLEMIYKVSELLKHSLSIDEFLEKVLEFISEVLPRIDTSAILLYDIQEGQIKDVISNSKQGDGKAGVSYSRSVVDRVIREGKTIRMSNTTYEDPDSLSDSMSTLQLGSIMCVPMISNSQIRGVIYVDSFREAYGFRKEDLLLLNTLSGPLAVAIEKAMLTSQL